MMTTMMTGAECSGDLKFFRFKNDIVEIRGPGGKGVGGIGITDQTRGKKEIIAKKEILIS